MCNLCQSLSCVHIHTRVLFIKSLLSYLQMLRVAWLAWASIDSLVWNLGVFLEQLSGGSVPVFAFFPQKPLPDLEEIKQRDVCGL